MERTGMKDNKHKKPRILDNLGLRIIALLIAIVMWILVNNANDPVVTRRFANISVQLQNTSMITSRGEVYTVLDNTDTVPVVTVRARRSIFNELTRDDIVATADVADITSLDTIEIKYRSLNYNSEIEEIDGSIDNVLLSIENRRTATFALQLDTTGSVADGYELDTVTPEQNQIRVSGPESVVSQIASARATVDISGATSSISTYADVKLYDADGNAVDTSRLTMNITSVKVSVSILPLKTVPITVTTSGTPADGYLTNGVVTVDPDTVKLAGRSSVLSGIDSIAIPAEAVNIDGSTQSFQTSVDIHSYLPDGVTLADESFNGVVNITVGIEAAYTTDISLNMSDIALENVPSGYRAQVSAVNDGQKTVTAESEPPTYTVTLTGVSAQVDAVKASDLSPVIDVGSLVESQDASGTATGTDISGTYTGIVSITVPDGIAMENTVIATVELARQGTAFSAVSSASSSSGAGDSSVDSDDDS